MNITGSLLRYAGLFGAVFWVCSAAAAPLPSHPRNSGVRFVSGMQDHAPVAVTESAEILPPALQRKLVNYATPAASGTIIIAVPARFASA